jgi:hypothetical protein
VSIDRELLWKAWPNGFVAMRGVQTVGDWLCWSGGDDDPSWVDVTNRHGFNSPFTYTFDQKTLKIGDLLPKVDPSDAATWACLLRDLAEAVPVDSWFHAEGPHEPTWLGPSQMHHFNLSWAQSSRGEEFNYGLTATCRRINSDPNDCAESTTYYRRFVFDHDVDPAMALVLARIQLRETS